MRRLRSWLRRVILRRSSPRAHNPFTTHVPVLIAIGRLLGARRVLELGCGDYSTLTFLDTAAFPTLRHLRSVETDAAWLQRLSSQTRDDARVVMTHVATAMSEALDTMSLSEFDLVFIDDSIETEARAATIRQVARRASDQTVVLIHDFETPEYREAARAFRHRYAFTALRPNTGIAWNGARLNRVTLAVLNGLIRLASFTTDPADRTRWAALLTRMVPLPTRRARTDMRE